MLNSRFRVSIWLCIVAGCLFLMSCEKRSDEMNCPTLPYPGDFGWRRVSVRPYISAISNSENDNEILFTYFTQDSAVVGIYNFETKARRMIFQKPLPESFGGVGWAPGGRILVNTQLEGRIYIISPEGQILNEIAQGKGKYVFAWWTHDYEGILADTFSSGMTTLFDLNGNIVRRHSRAEARKLSRAHAYFDDSAIIYADTSSMGVYSYKDSSYTPIIPIAANSAATQPISGTPINNDEFIWPGYEGIYRTNRRTFATQRIKKVCGETQGYGIPIVNKSRTKLFWRRTDRYSLEQGVLTSESKVFVTDINVGNEMEIMIFK